MVITTDMIKTLLSNTGAGILECKKALNETNGDQEKAIDLLRKKGVSVAESKFGRATAEGLIGSYIHFGGKIGVMVEMNCETDFVARTDEFKELLKDIAMHIAASNPLFLSEDDVDKEMLEKEKEIFAEQAKAAGKPDKIIEKIVEGRVKKYYKEICLLLQPFVKDPDITVADRITETLSKLRENIKVNRFVRWEIGKE